MIEPVVALFCGSRDWRDWDAIEADVASLPEGSVVVHGAQRGADTIAGVLANRRGLHVARVPPRWDLFGNGAGRKRNEALALLLANGPRVGFAYPLDGPGTPMMVGLAAAVGVDLTIRRAA